MLLKGGECGCKRGEALGVLLMCGLDLCIVVIGGEVGSGQVFECCMSSCEEAIEVRDLGWGRRFVGGAMSGVLRPVAL